MRILVCTAELPLAPMNGLRLQIAAVFDAIAARHDVTVLGYRHADQHEPGRDGMDLIDLPVPRFTLPRRAASYLASTPRGLPAATALFEPPMRRALEQLLDRRSFDVAYVTNPPMAGLVTSLGGLPAVLGALDSWEAIVAARLRLMPLPIRPLYALERTLVRRFTRRHYPSYSSVVAVTEQDARAISTVAPEARCEVIPNGVDTDFFAPDPAREPESGHVVFTGVMSYPANIAAAERLALEIMPLVRARRPDARLSIVGRAPDDRVRTLADREHVQVHADVPDVRPWLYSADVYACPMVSGTGIKNKVLEALACATAVVASPLACQGMDVTDGRELRIAEEPADAADAIVELIEDREQRARVAAAGREYVLRRHGWDGAARAYEALLERAAA